jgi:proteasome accessory factor C
VTRLREQIERLLLVVSVVRARPGVTLEEVASAVGVTAEELRDELLPLLSLVGKPPFSPADLIDLWLDDEGRLHLELDQSLGRPLRLTAEESLALRVALEAAASSGLSAFAARARALSARLATLFAQAASDHAPTDGAPLAIDARADTPQLATVERAVAERRALTITYFSASRDAISTRRLEPWALLEVLGAWYVVGRDGQSGDARMFKIERIAEAQLTDQRFEPPASFDPRAWVDAGQFVAARPGARAGGGVATVRVRGPAVELVLDEGRRAKPAPAEVDEGAVEVELPYLDPRWAAAWVMALGDDATLVGPDEVKRALAERAAATLALYEE